MNTPSNDNNIHVQTDQPVHITYEKECTTLTNNPNENTNNNYSENTFTQEDSISIQSSLDSTTLLTPKVNIHWGDDIEIPTDSQHIRIYFQNINSISNKTMKKWNTIIDNMKKFDCSIFGLAETCVDWDNPQTKERYNKSLRNKCKSNRLTGSKNKCKKFSNQIPGGTLTATIGNISARVQGPRIYSRSKTVRKMERSKNAPTK